LVALRNPLANRRDGDTGKIAIYVRRVAAGTFSVFSVHCTHLGCPVNWIAEAGLFMCPCHGGVFYEDGAHASGPPPRGLYEFEHRIENGRLWVKLGHLPTLAQPASSKPTGHTP
ncbi:MAG: Rieske (2Fe-2S) protein, partial [Planctomycetales bacterium]|nr:Rieske (2Fe-2S) protein [Planctomycetales bacterium]